MVEVAPSPKSQRKPSGCGPSSGSIDSALCQDSRPQPARRHAHNAEAHHSQDAEGDSHDSHKHESKEGSCCSTLKAVVPTAKAIVFNKQVFHPIPSLCVLPETHAASLALSENPPNRQAKPRDWVFTPVVCLGPAHRSLAPPAFV